MRATGQGSVAFDPEWAEYLRWLAEENRAAAS